MQIQNNNYVNFEARYISAAKAAEKINNKWKNIDVSFIKFDTSKKADIEALETVRNLWSGKNLSSGIVEESRVLGRKAQVYAVTKQQGNFEDVEPSKILGLMTTDKISKGTPVEIFKIGTDPKYAYEQNTRTRDMKHIARGMIDAFKKFVKGKSKSEVIVNYAEPQEYKFLQRVDLNPKSNYIVELNR